MQRPTRAELEAFRGRTIEPLVADGLRLLFVGINPGLWTAATNTPFAHPGNRFYPALHRAGLIDDIPAFSDGLDEAGRRLLTDRGIGIDNLVARATARADELTRDELRQGAVALAARVEAWRPAVVAVAGVTAYRQAFGRPRAAQGEQEEALGGARLWVVPNPSGLNAHDTIDSLAAAYRAPATAAGIV